MAMLSDPAGMQVYDCHPRATEMSPPVSTLIISSLRLFTVTQEVQTSTIPKFHCQILNDRQISFTDTFISKSAIILCSL